MTTDQRLESRVDKQEARTEEQGKALQTLTVQVTKIATIVENAEQRRNEDVTLIKDALGGIKEVNDRMSATLTLQSEVANLKDVVLEMKGDVRVNKHDIATALQGTAGIPVLGSKISGLAGKVEALEKINSRTEGGKAAYMRTAHVMWLLFGGAVLVAIDTALKFYYGGVGK